MTLHLISIGLADERDITFKGLEAIKKCTKVYLESYTSILQCTKEQLEKFYEKPLILASRHMTENNMQKILDEAKTEDVALLIIGDIFAATTHINYLIEAKKQGITIKTIHNASIITAVGEIGLELYKYGRITSIPFAESDTPYKVLAENQKSSLHTLILLDLNPESNTYLTISEAIKKLEISETKLKGGIISPDTMLVGCARLGSSSQKIFAGSLNELKKESFGNPPYCIIIPSKKLHFIEEEALSMWRK